MKQDFKIKLAMPESCCVNNGKGNILFRNHLDLLLAVFIFVNSILLVAMIPTKIKICTLTFQYSLYCWTLHCSCFTGCEDVVFFQRVLNIWRRFLYYFWSLWEKNIFWKARMLFTFFLIFVGGWMICQFSKKKRKKSLFNWSTFGFTLCTYL